MMNASTPEQQKFIHRFQSTLSQCRDQFENDDLKIKALSIIPIDKLHVTAQNQHKTYKKQQQENSQPEELGFEDFLVKALLSWFKSEFFKWVDKPNCQVCNEPNPKLLGGARPNAQEAPYLPGIVELYQCEKCMQITRFPRYNHAGKLLDTKCGRCGEWAQCFTMCVSAIGFNARYVMDWTDHVWTEYYSPHLKRWVHCDPCENAFDSPLMYEQGWGKQLTYVVGFSGDEAVDVTKRYTRKYEEVLKRRTSVTEEWLENALKMVNMQLDIFKTPDKLKEVQQRRDLEQVELRNSQLNEEERRLKEEETIGRISGSEEWKKSRGETGDPNKKCTTTENLNATTDIRKNVLVENWNEENKKSLKGVSWIENFRLDKLEEKNINEKFHSIGNCRLYGKSQNLNEVSLCELTENKPSQNGAVWTQRRQYVKGGFSTTFEFIIESSNNQHAADGFAFVLYNRDEKDILIGEGGCGLGYQNLKYSLAIEFDIYQTSDRCADPDENHISIHCSKSPSQGNSAHHGTHSIACTSNLQQKHNILLADNKKHKARIVYFSNTLFVFIDRIDFEKDDTIVPVLTCVDVDLEKWLDLEKYEGCTFVGFTGSTGGLHASIQILNWYEFSSLQGHEQYFPLRKFYSFKSANVKGIRSKLLSFCDSSGMDKEDKQSIVVPMLDSIQESRFFSIKEKQIWFVIHNMLLKWDTKKLFPVIDVVRILAIECPSKVNAVLSVEGDDTLERLMNEVLKEKSYANTMLFFRFLCNLSSLSEYKKIISRLIGNISEYIISLDISPSTDKVNLRLAYASLLCNLSMLTENQNNEENEHVISLLSATCESLKREVKNFKDNEEIIYQMLLAIGTICTKSEEEIIDLCVALDIKQIIDTIKSKDNTTLSGVSNQLLYVILEDEKKKL